MIVRRDMFTDFFREMNRLQDEMGRFFGRSGIPATGSIPFVNVWEDEQSVFVTADLPGIDIDKLDISVVEGNQLTISGERPVTEMANAVWLRQERAAGSFARMLTLPTLVDADRVEATYEDGVLHIALPKAEAAKPRKIAVKSV